MTRRRVGAALFDVDQTLITGKSLISFLHHHWLAADRPPGGAEHATAALLARARAGVPREVLNRDYYRLLAGQSLADLTAQGREWFDRELRHGLFHPPVLSAFRDHARAGHLTVLISGSFAPCLKPIADHLGAQCVFGTVPHVRDGMLTGEIGTPMIGQEKARTAKDLLTLLAIDPSDAAAYGDDASDLPLLRLVGSPVLVADDPQLLAEARRSSWACLPAASGGNRAFTPGGLAA
jgi:HAD superfamily hydrolase (TIGR01490 family)